MALAQPVTQEAIQTTFDQFAAQFVQLVQRAVDITTWTNANITEANRVANMLLAWDGKPMTTAQLAQAQALLAPLGRLAQWATTPLAQGQPSPIDYVRQQSRIVR